MGFGPTARRTRWVSLRPGQPPYDPADLLKLYLYGYAHRIRSSRSLEREACRNLELIWLMKGLKPGYRTIANFRKENWAALRAANREFVLMARELGLVGGEVLAIDGAFFDGSASKASITTRKKLAERLAALDRDIEGYQATLTENDAAEDAQPAVGASADPEVSQTYRGTDGQTRPGASGSGAALRTSGSGLRSSTCVYRANEPFMLQMRLPKDRG